MDYSHIHTIFLQRIIDVRKKENQTVFLFGLFLLLITSVCSIAVVSLLEELFHFGTIIRGIFFFSALVIILAIAIKFFFPPLLRMLNIAENKNEELLAEQIGSFFPQIRDKLYNALQLIQERKQISALYSPLLIDASLNDLYQEVQSVNFLRCIDTTKLKKIRKQFYLSLALVCVLFLSSPTSFLSAFTRILHFQQTYDAPPQFVIRIEPGNKEIVRGESIPITVSIEQREISFTSFERKTLTLFKRLQGQVNYESQILRANANGMFTSEFSVVKSPTFYFAEFHDVRSDEYVITVVDKPLIRSFRINVTPPRYTKLPKKELEENVGDVAEYKGTNISFELTSSKELQHATLLFSDSSTVPLKINRKKAEVSFLLFATQNYHFRIEDVDKLFNDNPIEYRLTVIPDEIPTAAIIVPGKNIDADESMQLEMLFRLSDDFGFTKLHLAQKLVHSKYSASEENFHFIPIPFSSSVKQREFPYRWNFTGRNLAPEDVLMYYIEVFDNDNVSGPKSGKSQTYLLRLPSLDEVFAEAEQQQNETLESLSSASQQAQQLRKELEKLQQELKKRPDKVDWLQKKKAEELAKKYDEVKQKVATAAQQMKQAEQHQLLSPQTMQKYDELQKMMKELDSPEFRELLKKLQQQHQPLSPEQMKEAMKNFSMNEEQFRKALERMLELLKRMAMEQKLDELIKRTEEAIKQQKKLQEETQNSSKEKLNELSKQQSDLEKQTDKLEQEAKELAEKMEELADEMPADKMEQANEHFEKNNPQQQMKNAQQQMKSGQQQQAQQSQQQARQSLEQFLSELQQAQKEMRSKQQQQIVREMQKQLENVLQVSKNQEQLKNETQQLEYNSPRFRENAQKQYAMNNDVQNIANALSELGKKSFSISPEMGKTLGDAMKQMESAMNGMEARNAQSSTQQQNAAMGSLNRAAAMMQKSLQGMQGSGGGGMGMQGMMQAMGQMASQQQGINEGTQGALGQGNGMSMEQAAAMSKLAQQQSGLQKSLQELAGESKRSDEMSRLLGDLDYIAKEMQEVVRDMEQGTVNPETLRKQERILSRLLDSQRSLREKDYEKRRRAEQSNVTARPSPIELDMQSLEGKNKLQQDLLKALNEKYTKDFESLIRKYFEELQKQESKPQ